MKPATRSLLWLAIGSIALSCVAFVLIRGQELGSKPAPVPRPALATPSLAVDSTNVASKAPEATASKPAVGERFKNEKDYFALADSLIDKAQAGDSEAQFYLYEILSYCASDYVAYFRTRSGDRTLAEAKERASRTFGLRPELAEEVYNRCFKLMARSASNRFGTREEWIGRAVENGHPLAELTRAQQLYYEANTESVRGELQQNVPVPRDQLRARARELVEQALPHAGEPEVLWRLAEVVPGYSGEGGDLNAEVWAWRMAACDRGFDCTSGAEWVGFQCRNGAACEAGTDGVDVIRTLTGDSFSSVKKEAVKINGIIDAKDWGGVGSSAGGPRFGAGVTDVSEFLCSEAD